MTTTWHCLNCPATGETQASAARHVDETRHATQHGDAAMTRRARLRILAVTLALLWLIVWAAS